MIVLYHLSYKQDGGELLGGGGIDGEDIGCGWRWGEEGDANTKQLGSKNSKVMPRNDYVYVPTARRVKTSAPRRAMGAQP